MPAAKKVYPTFNHGDYVTILHTNGLKGKIIALRGPLGPGGAAVYGVRFGCKSHRRYVEVLGDQLVLRARTPRATPQPVASPASPPSRPDAA